MALILAARGQVGGYKRAGWYHAVPTTNAQATMTYANVSAFSSDMTEDRHSF